MLSGGLCIHFRGIEGQLQQQVLVGFLFLQFLVQAGDMLTETLVAQ